MPNKSYPFLDYIREDKSRYQKASDAGYYDPYDLFLIGDSGGFLLNINEGYKFVNTYLLHEMADFYRKNKCYTYFQQDSIPHRQLRKREEYRRANGFDAPCLMCPDGSIKDIHITGHHYNFLNYTLIEQLDESSVKIGSNSAVGKKIQDFSKFIDAQYWTFQVIEFARNNGFHLIIDKTRRGGFSYIMASKSANNLNLRKKKVVIHVADDKKYLTKTGGLTDFTINNLRFYELNTPFVRGIYSTDKENYKLGFKLPNGIESPKSWGSTLFSVSAANNPDCAIGKDAIEVEVEELSTMENFDEFMTVTEPAMRTGSYVTGNLNAWGTATSGNMQIFERNFYSPRSFNFMPFENVWDDNARSEVCGYFKPYCWGLQGEIDGVKALDKDGNSNIEVALKVAEKERIDKKATCKTYAEYLNYLGQYALRPAESFSSATENIFSSDELTAWEDRLRTDTAFKFYVDGMLYEENGRVVFKTNERLLAEGKKLNTEVFEWIQGVPRHGTEHPHGCIRKWFSPQTVEYVDKRGNRVKEVPPGLYSMTYDPVGINKEKNEITNRHSHNSIKVWMNPHQLNGFKPKLVAAYYGRPDKLEEADWICYLLARYYNCVGTVAVEVNRGETVSNFNKWKGLRYLEKEPVFVWDTSVKGMVSNNYGYSIGDNVKKLEGLRLLKEYLYQVIGSTETGAPVRVFHTIYDYQSILELKKWNSTGNFDRVSEMLLRGIQWRSMDIVAAKQLQSRKKLNDETTTKNILKRNWF